ncbi:MAG TPA: hypothetical protein VFG02_08945 [Nitrospirota bacterium]|nr:hypothetical protein [Nitrospirota bacterium]
MSRLRGVWQEILKHRCRIPYAAKSVMEIVEHRNSSQVSSKSKTHVFSIETRRQLAKLSNVSVGDLFS